MREIGDYITCITTKCDDSCAWKYISKGKQYMVIENHDNRYYTIVDDSGDVYSFPIEQFHSKEELRDIKLEKLGI